jgi:hypothetical protein
MRRPQEGCGANVGVNATKLSGTLRGSCGENCIPNFGRPFVFDVKLSEFELIFPDPMHKFDAGNRRCARDGLSCGYVGSAAAFFHVIFQRAVQVSVRL